MAKLGFKGISPRRLMKLYAGANGGPAATRDLLAFHLREGSLRARAKHLWISKEKTLSAAWRSEPKDTENLGEHRSAKPHDLKRAAWWRSVAWQSDVTNWQFKRRRFVLTLCVSPPKRLMIRDIFFHGGDVKACFDPNSRSAEKRPGRPVERDQWRMFWHEIVRLIQNGNSDFGTLGVKSNEQSANLVLQELSDSGRQDDEERLTKNMAKRIPFKLSYDAVHDEVKALRREFGLSRRPKKSE